MYKVLPGFIAQGGDFTRGNGTGGESIYGMAFDDEHLEHLDGRLVRPPGRSSFLICRAFS